MQQRFLWTFLVLLLPLAVAAAPLTTVTLTVQNMTCPVCPITVKKSLEMFAGVQAVTVDFPTKTATVTFDPDAAHLEALTQATANAGYPSTVHPQEPADHVTH